MEETLLATKETKKRQEKRREEKKLSNKIGDSKLPPPPHTHTQVPYSVIN